LDDKTHRKDFRRFKVEDFRRFLLLFFFSFTEDVVENQQNRDKSFFEVWFSPKKCREIFE